MKQRIQDFSRRGAEAQRRRDLLLSPLSASLRLCVKSALFFSIPLSVGMSGQLPKFFPDDPLLVDEDNLDVPDKPAEIELSDLFDRFSHTFTDFGSDAWGEAENVNTLDEVPDSSWFTNRHGKRRMSIDDLVRGPDSGAKPDPGQTWTIFRGKQQGITPGFHIEDEGGKRYVIKFGAVSDPRLSTSSEIIATKILHAIGYYTPENYIVYLNADKLRIRAGTTVTDAYGDELRLSEGRLRQMLGRAKKEPDGTYRAIASKYIDGEPLGPFRYYGRRSDDPNDLWDHEQRRELRGLRLISAWINHDDTRSQNTQDSWISEGGKHFVRHYLIDFGSCFGSGTAGLQLPALTWHYWMDGQLMKRNAGGFGFHVPKYRKVNWPKQPEFSAVGRFESKEFDAGQWLSEYPNPAFVRETERDAFWAAKLIMRFNQEELRAIVKTGQINDARQEDYFLKTLIERQRKCGDYGFNRVNPLDGFRLRGTNLEFTNLSEQYGLGASGSTYQARWSVYDNASGSSRDIGRETTVDAARLSIPSQSLSGDSYLAVSIRTQNASHPAWNREVRVYLRPAGSSYKIVGIERESTPSLPPE